MRARVTEAKTHRDVDETKRERQKTQRNRHTVDMTERREKTGTPTETKTHPPTNHTQNAQRRLFRNFVNITAPISSNHTRSFSPMCQHLPRACLRSGSLGSHRRRNSPRFHHNVTVSLSQRIRTLFAGGLIQSRGGLPTQTVSFAIVEALDDDMCADAIGGPRWGERGIAGIMGKQGNC